MDPAFLGLFKYQLINQFAGFRFIIVIPFHRRKSQILVNKLEALTYLILVVFSFNVILEYALVAL